MKIIELEPEFILDQDSEMEIIHMDVGYKDIPYGFFYTKYKYLSYDFNGKKIEDKKDYIRTKSLWFVDFSDKSKYEVLPFGDYDINETSIIGNYLYITKIIDKDQDGILEYDYDGGDIYRINIHNLQVEFCCNIEPYNFHGFEVATEQFLVFRSEDQIPDTDEIVFIDLKNKTKAILLNDWNKECMDYTFIFDEFGTPIYVITKRYVNKDEIGSSNDKLGCFSWTNFLNKLKWNSL
ncbi:hypothetical protein [Clostridium sp. YIM B02551]|uniref:hypothetical protein n=1 Tax=Clostridium sp. YIM B02551 TaxID=2910679 RepID=UPI001EEC5F7B|nr:hypothetical protein [Clostridium sp. YIM B02551]